MAFIWQESLPESNPANLVERIEQEVLYVIRSRGRSELRFLLVLLDDEFPDARPADLAQAVGNLLDHGTVELGRCDHGTTEHLCCGCITLEMPDWLRSTTVDREAT